jgi:hypothetical protein
MAVQPFVRAAAYMNIDHLGERNGKLSSPLSIPARQEQHIGAKLERPGGVVAALLSEHHRVPSTTFLHLHRVDNTRRCDIREIPDMPRGLRGARFGEDGAVGVTVAPCRSVALDPVTTKRTACSSGSASRASMSGGVRRSCCAAFIGGSRLPS